MIGNLVAAGLLADARTACGRQARTVQTMWACGPAHRRPVPAHEIPGHGSGQPSEDRYAAQVSADADNQGAGQPVTGFGTKKAAFLSRYRAHPQYGNRSAAGRVAAELAPLAGLQAGTGRTYIAEELRKLTGMASPRPAEEGR